MCGFCAMLSGSIHWTEAGTAAAEAPPPASGPERRAARLRRVRIVDRIARHYGCRVGDWMTDQYVVSSLRGRTELVDSLPQVWQVIEAIAGRSTDPLAPDLLADLGKDADG